MSPYTYIWSFRVKSARLDDFLRHYDRGGSWERLFRQAPGYLGTRLLLDCDDPLRFVTIDEWIDEEHYQQFQRQFTHAYEALDSECEGLTESESLIGQFRARER